MVGVWWHVDNTKLLKHKSIRVHCRLFYIYIYIYIYTHTHTHTHIYIYENHSGVFGDLLLLQVVLVDTTNFWSYDLCFDLWIFIPYLYTSNTMGMNHLKISIVYYDESINKVHFNLLHSIFWCHVMCSSKIYCCMLYSQQLLWKFFHLFILAPCFGLIVPHSV